MTARRLRRSGVRRILAGLVLVASTVLCAFVQNDTDPPERVAWLCSPTKPHCIAMTEAGQ